MKRSQQFAQDGFQYSQTEEYGLSLLTAAHKRVLSIGISTAGFAELRMLLAEPERTVVATTLDPNGLEFTRQLLEKKHSQASNLVQVIAQKPELA